MKKHVLLMAALLMALFLAGNALADQTAVDITADCTLTACYSRHGVKSLADRRFTSCWESQDMEHPWVTITAPAGVPMYGAYVCFTDQPGAYMWQAEKDGTWVDLDCDIHPELLHAYYAFPEGVSRLRLYLTGEGKRSVRVNELYVFSSGTVPDWVQRWEPAPEKADILFVTAHPDDQLVFLGGALPTYITERQCSVAVACLTRAEKGRVSELLNALWAMGLRQYPFFGGWKDMNPNTVEQAYAKLGGEENVVGWLTQVYQACKPEVVVTLDAAGENGHVMHKLTADAAQKAYTAAAQAGWQVKKLYQHLGAEQQITMDWSIPLTRAAGKTAMEAAAEAYASFTTQERNGMSVVKTGAKYDNRLFGLWETTVGPDTVGGDFLENVTELVKMPVQSLQAVQVPSVPLGEEYLSLMPTLNAKGFLDAGEFVYASDTEGLYLYVNQTCKIVIRRRVDATQPLRWFDAEIWCDVEAGELLRSVAYDAEKMEKAHVDASETAIKHQVVFATNTDYYTYRLSSNNGRPIGLVIRDGKILYDTPYTKPTKNFPNLDTLSFYPDGHLEVHESGAMTGQEFLDRGAYMVFSFGPYLLKDGEINPRLKEISSSNQPRYALGMVEPGHYVALIAEGRFQDSVGVSITQLALMLRERGCTLGYNLDGGQTAVFEFMGKQLNSIAVYYGKTCPRKTSEVMGVGTSELVGHVTFE